MHPVPYVGSKTYPDGGDADGAFGKGWFRRDDGGARRRFRAVALFTTEGKRDPARRIIHDHCANSTRCETIEDMNVRWDVLSFFRLPRESVPHRPCRRREEHAHTKSYQRERINALTFEAYNRDADFCLQPPGHSAARKGIVDALMAGCVPVLTHHDGVDAGFFHPLDPPDVWPWNWPWQYASSIALSPKDVENHGLMTLLDRVDERQLALMRRVIAELAPNLAYPLSLGPAPAADARAREPKPPWNALLLAMHHLSAVARLTTARRRE